MWHSVLSIGTSPDTKTVMYTVKCVVDHCPCRLEQSCFEKWEVSTPHNLVQDLEQPVLVCYHCITNTLYVCFKIQNLLSMQVCISNVLEDIYTYIHCNLPPSTMSAVE